MSGYRSNNDRDDFIEIAEAWRTTTKALCHVPDVTRREMKVWASIMSIVGGDRRLHDGITTAVLSDMTGIERHNLTRVFKKLHERGMIVWQPARGRNAVSHVGYGKGVTHTTPFTAEKVSSRSEKVSSRARKGVRAMTHTTVTTTTHREDEVVTSGATEAFLWPAGIDRAEAEEVYEAHLEEVAVDGEADDTDRATAAALTFCELGEAENKSKVADIIMGIAGVIEGPFDPKDCCDLAVWAINVRRLRPKQIDHKLDEIRHRHPRSVQYVRTALKRIDSGATSPAKAATAAQGHRKDDGGSNNTPAPSKLAIPSNWRVVS